MVLIDYKEKQPVFALHMIKSRIIKERIDKMYNWYEHKPSRLSNGNASYMNNKLYSTAGNRLNKQNGSWHSYKDYGPEPFVVNIEEATMRNNTFRTALWTGEHLQLTLMSIKPGEDIGLEIHPDLDQFVRIEEGKGIVKMGDRKDNLRFRKDVFADYAFVIPAGKWHNLINTGKTPLKLYSIYAPPQHPRGTVHETKEDAEAAERRYKY